MGDTTLELTRELAGTDLAAVAEGNEDIVATAVGVVPLSARPRSAARTRHAVSHSGPGVAASATRCTDTSAGGVVGARLCRLPGRRGRRRVRRAALLIDPGQASELAEPYESVLYRLAVLLAGLAVALGLYAILRPRLRAAELATGMLVVLGLVGVLLALTLPGVSGLVVQPSLAVAGVRCSRRCFSPGARSPPARTCLLWPSPR